MNYLQNRLVKAVCATVLVSCAALRAEDAAPDKPKAPADQKKADDRTRGQAFGRGNYTPGGGMTDMIGNAMGGGNGIAGIMSRMLGISIDDPKAPVKLDALPLGASKRMVTQIPVGGVDNFISTGSGWKMETVFKLTPEQTTQTDALREEYAAEQKKLNVEILEAEKALAAKVAELRAKYEKKANELLSGADKEAKEKMDALAAEVNAKNAASVAETMPLFDPKDWQQSMALVKTLREKTTVVTKDGEDKLLALIPQENRGKFQDIIKIQNDQRNRMNQYMQGGGFRNRGGPGGADAGGRDRFDGPPVAPPKAPEGDKF
ncbi:MAG: hypothetical protein WCT04_04340 [Planctomycetota bacterium]